MRRRDFMTIVGGAAGVWARPAWAQDSYPSHSVTLVVPFAPGGSIDTFTRVLGQKLSARLGQSFVVENRPGAGTVTATAALAKSAPDGYTLLIAPSALAINVSLHKTLPFNTEKDLVSVAHYVTVPLVLVVNNDLPVHSVADLVKHAKANPEKLSFGSTGVGAAPHLAGGVFKARAGIEMTHVPYRGVMPALSDVMAGHVQLTFSEPSSALPLVKQGKVRGLGVTSNVRIPAAPEIPTIAESAMPGFEAISWFLLLAPAATPNAVVEKLNREVKAMIATPEMRDLIVKMGLIPIDTPPPGQLRSFLSSEIQRWRAAVEHAGLAGSVQ